MNFLKRLFTTRCPEWKDTIVFHPPLKKVYVIKVYDGDTITIASKLSFHSQWYRWSVRIRGIDCPELKSKNIEEKEIAQKAQQFLSNFILHKQVNIHNISKDKYGRLLCDVFFQNKNISDIMIEKKLAVKYFGGKKQVPENWKEYYLNKM
jgi:endonuclease YncB( thermonuclease family)